MEYNKNKFDKVNDKKVLHKIKKHWVVVSLALLSAIGAGGAATTANASTTGQSLDNANHSSQLNRALNTQKTGLEKVSSDQNSQNSANHSAGSSTTEQQAATLHDRILRANYLGNGRSVSANNSGQATNYHSASGNEVQHAITLHNRIIRSTHDYIANNQNYQTETMHMQPRQTQMSAIASEPTLGDDENTDTNTDNSASGTDASAVAASLSNIEASAEQVVSDYHSLVSYSSNASVTNSSAYSSLSGWVNGTHTEWSISNAPNIGAPGTYPVWVSSDNISNADFTNQSTVKNDISNYSSNNETCTYYKASSENASSMSSALNEYGVASEDKVDASMHIDAIDDDWNSQTLSNARTALIDLSSEVSSASQELSKSASSVNSNIYSDQNQLESAFSDLGDEETVNDGKYAADNNDANEFSTYYYHGINDFNGDENRNSVCTNYYNNQASAAANVQTSYQLYSALDNTQVRMINVESNISVSDSDPANDYNHQIQPAHPVTINGNGNTLTFSNECIDNTSNMSIENVNINCNGDPNTDFNGPFTNQGTTSPDNKITFDNVNFEGGPRLINTTNGNVVLAGNITVNSNRRYKGDDDLPNITAKSITVEPGTQYNGATEHGDVWQVINGDIQIGGRNAHGHNTVINLNPGDSNGNYPSGYSGSTKYGNNSYYGIFQQHGNFNVDKNAQINITPDSSYEDHNNNYTDALALSHVNANIKGQLNINYSDPNHQIDVDDSPFDIANNNYRSPIYLASSIMNVTDGGKFNVHEKSSNNSHMSLVYVDENSHLNIFKQGNMVLSDDKPSPGFTLLDNAGTVNIENPGNVHHLGEANDPGVQLILQSDSNVHSTRLISNDIKNIYSVNVGQNGSFTGNVYRAKVPVTGGITVNNDSTPITGNVSSDASLEFEPTPIATFNNDHYGDTGNGAGFYIPDSSHVKGDLLVDNDDKSPIYVRVSDNHYPEYFGQSINADADNAEDSRQISDYEVSSHYTFKFYPVSGAIVDGYRQYRESDGTGLINGAVYAHENSDNQVNLPFTSVLHHFNNDGHNSIRVTVHSGVNTIVQTLYDDKDSNGKNGHVRLSTVDVNPDDDDTGAFSNDTLLNHPSSNSVIWKYSTLGHNIAQNDNSNVPIEGEVMFDYVDGNQTVSSAVDFGQSGADVGQSRIHAFDEKNVSNNGNQYYVNSNQTGFPEYGQSTSYSIYVVSSASVASVAASDASNDISGNPYSSQAAHHYDDDYYTDVVSSASNTVQSESIANQSLRASASDPTESTALNSAKNVISAELSSINSSGIDSLSVESAAKSAHAAAAAADSVVTEVDSLSLNNDKTAANGDVQQANAKVGLIRNNNHFRNLAANDAAKAESASIAIDHLVADANAQNSIAMKYATSAYNANSASGHGNDVTGYASYANAAASEANADDSSASAENYLASSYSDDVTGESNFAAQTNGMSTSVGSYYDDVVGSCRINVSHAARDSGVKADPVAAAEIKTSSQAIALAAANINDYRLDSPSTDLTAAARTQYENASTAALEADKVQASADIVFASSAEQFAAKSASEVSDIAQSASASASGVARDDKDSLMVAHASYSASSNSALVSSADNTTISQGDKTELENDGSDASELVSSASNAASVANYRAHLIEANYNQALAYSQIIQNQDTDTSIHSAVANVNNASNDVNVRHDPATSYEVNNDKQSIDAASTAIKTDNQRPLDASKVAAITNQLASASVDASAADKLEASLDSSVADSEATNAASDASTAAEFAQALSSDAANLQQSAGLPGMAAEINAIDYAANAASISADDASANANRASLAANDADYDAGNASYADDGASASSYAKLTSEAVAKVTDQSIQASLALRNNSVAAEHGDKDTSKINSKADDLQAESSAVYSEMTNNINSVSMDPNVASNMSASSAVSSDSDIVSNAADSISSESTAVSENPNDPSDPTSIQEAFEQSLSANSATIDADFREISVNNSAARTIMDKTSRDSVAVTSEFKAASEYADALLHEPDVADSTKAHQYVDAAKTDFQNARKLDKSARDDWSAIKKDDYLAQRAVDRNGNNVCGTTSEYGKEAYLTAMKASGILGQISYASADASDKASSAVSYANAAAYHDKDQTMDNVGLTSARGSSAANDTSVKKDPQLADKIGYENRVISLASKAIANDSHRRHAMDDIKTAAKAADALKSAEAYEVDADRNVANVAVHGTNEVNGASQNADSANKTANAASNKVNNQINPIQPNIANHDDRSNAISYANAAVNEAESAAADSKATTNELGFVNADRFVAKQTNGAMAFGKAKDASLDAVQANKDSTAAANASTSAANDSAKVDEYINNVKTDDQLTDDNWNRAGKATTDANLAKNASVAADDDAQTAGTYSTKAADDSNGIEAIKTFIDKSKHPNINNASNIMNTIVNAASGYNHDASVAYAAASEASTSAQNDYSDANSMIAAAKTAANSYNTSAAKNAEQRADADQSNASVAAASAAKDMNDASTAANQVAAESGSANTVVYNFKHMVGAIAVKKARHYANFAQNDFYEAIRGNAMNDEIISSVPSSLSNDEKPTYDSSSADHALASVTSASNAVAGINNTINLLSNVDKNYHDASANSSLVSVSNGISLIAAEITNASSSAKSANQLASNYASDANQDYGLASSASGIGNDDAAANYAVSAENAYQSANSAFAITNNNVKLVSDEVSSAESYANVANDINNSLSSQAHTAGQNVQNVASNAAANAAQVQSVNSSLTSASNEIANNSAAVQSASVTVNSYSNDSANAKLATIIASVNAASLSAASAMTAINSEKNSVASAATVAGQQASLANSTTNNASASNLSYANSASALVANDSSEINSNVGKVASIAAQTSNYANSASNLITSLNSSDSVTASDYARDANSRATSLAKIGTNVNNSAASASQNAASVSQANAAVKSDSNLINGYHNSSADQFMRALSASASAANQATASEQASIANAAQQINNRVNDANRAAASAANFAKSGDVNNASVADSSAASLANDVNQTSAALSTEAQSLASAAAKLNGIKNYDQFLNIKNLNAQAAANAAQVASQAAIEVNGLQSSVAAQISAKVADENRRIAYDSSSASNYQDSNANAVMSNDAQDGSADNSSAGSYDAVVVNAIQSASQDAVAASSAASVASAAANAGNGSLAVNESNAVSNYAANVNSLSATASTAVNSMELVSLSAASTVAETNHLLSNLSTRTIDQSCSIGINYVNSQNSEIDHVPTAGFKGSAFNLANYINGAPAGYHSVQVLYGADVSAYEPGDQEITIKVAPNSDSSSNGNGQPDPNWDANNGNPSVAPSSNSIHSSNGDGNYNSNVDNHSHRSSSNGQSGHSVDPNANNNADIDFNHRHHSHQTNNHDDSDVPSDVPSDDGGSDTGDQTPDNDAGDDQEPNDPSSNEPTTGDDDPSNNQEFRNGVNDARRGLSMQSNDSAYVQGYNDFNKAKLPQTGENHQHVGMATAMMMALAIASMGFGKASDRRRHNA